MSEKNRRDKLNALVEFQDAIVRYAGSLCRDWHVAQDLAQDVIIRAMNFDNLHKVANIKAWSFIVVKNLWIDRCRATARRPLVLTTSTKEHGTDDSIYHYTPNNEVDLYEKRGLKNDTTEMLFSDDIIAALNSISKIYRDPVILRSVHSHSYDEIARILDVPVGTVRSRISRGRGMLREIISRRQVAAQL